MALRFITLAKLDTVQQTDKYGRKSVKGFCQSHSPVTMKEVLIFINMATMKEDG